MASFSDFIWYTNHTNIFLVFQSQHTLPYIQVFILLFSSWNALSNLINDSDSLFPFLHHGRSWTHQTAFPFLSGYTIILPFFMFPCSNSFTCLNSGQWYVGRNDVCLTTLVPKIFPWGTLWPLPSNEPDSEALGDGPESLNNNVG